MLILSRRENENIVIGEDIVIKVIAIEKGAVKIGLEAPPNMVILREELKIAISEENRKSMNTGDVELHQLMNFKKKS